MDDIRANFDQLRFRLPYLRALWAHALEVWARTGEEQVLKEASVRYEPEPAPQLQPGILTPLQHTFLTRFFAYDLGQQFFLTGGTALAAFYLYHRLSADLGIFTVDDISDCGMLIADFEFRIGDLVGGQGRMSRRSKWLG